MEAGQEQAGGDGAEKVKLGKNVHKKKHIPLGGL